MKLPELTMAHGLEIYLTYQVAYTILVIGWHRYKLRRFKLRVKKEYETR